MKLIIYNNKMGDIVRIGLYDENNKWVKWIGKNYLINILMKSKKLKIK